MRNFAGNSWIGAQRMKTTMQRLSVLSLFLSIFAAALPVSGQEAASLKTGADANAPLANVAAHSLQISAGDLLDVNVFDTPELSGKFRVDERGAITLPLAGDLAVYGLTAQQAGHAMEARFLSTDILKDPHVSVIVLEYATQGVAVLGEVKNPGVYPLLGVHGLLDLVSAAGGITPNAGKAVTITHRNEPEKPIVVRMETKPGSTVGFNVDVRPGDTIMVSRAGVVYVLGDVGKPGGFLLENNDRLTVLQAVALAQGTNRTAALNAAKLIRKTEDGREQLPVPLGKILSNKAPDQTLADGDILFVPSSAAKSALRGMESILPAATSAALYRVP
jgi:polysaccharide biosynthesis/export protein